MQHSTFAELARPGFDPARRLAFSTFVITCPQRASLLRETLRSLAASAWPFEPEVVVDDGAGESPLERIRLTWERVLARAASATSEFVLLLEDDVVFGKWFHHNVQSWPLLRGLRPGQAFYASLYNNRRAFYVARPGERYLVAHPGSTWGSQAIVTTPATVRFILAHWTEEGSNPDERMPRIARRVTPIYHHVPSLVNQAFVPSTWNDGHHEALDFEPEWRAPD
jgi:hypothetical protein